MLSPLAPHSGQLVYIYETCRRRLKVTEMRQLLDGELPDKLANLGSAFNGMAFVDLQRPVPGDHY